MVNSFANNFWDEDFNGTVGYETLVTQLKEGKKFYDVFADFVRNRAKIEDDYGRSLVRLAQSAGCNEEIGSLQSSWEALKREMESIGAIHCDLSKHLIELSERSQKFREKQKNERIKIDESMKREQKEKKIIHDAMSKAKRAYEQRCKESDAAKEAFNNKSSYTPKEEEKLKKSMLRSKSNLENADSAYQSSVKQLEDARQKYALNMEDACNKFQSIEESRIKFLRNEMWLYANHGSTQAICIDEKYEECRKIFEKCSEKSDIQLFIHQKQTGTVQPAAIPYLNYYYNHNNSESLTSHSNASLPLKTSNTPTPRAATNNALPKLPPPNTVVPRLPSNTATPKTASNPIVTSHASRRNLPTEDSAYSDITEMRCMDDYNATIAQAIYQYDAQSEKELTLKPGDTLQVKKLVDDTWGIAELNGRTGAFPLAFVELL